MCVRPFGAKHMLTTPHHPQLVGMLGCFHGHLKVLCARCSGSTGGSSFLGVLLVLGLQAASKEEVHGVPAAEAAFGRFLVLTSQLPAYAQEAAALRTEIRV